MTESKKGVRDESYEVERMIARVYTAPVVIVVNGKVKVVRK